MTITRYSRDYNDMCEWPSGKWVKYSDHAAQLAVLKEENERLQRKAVEAYNAGATDAFGQVLATLPLGKIASCGGSVKDLLAYLKETCRSHESIGALKEENERLSEALLRSIGFQKIAENESAALRARVAELEAREARLKTAVEKISANPYWDHPADFTEGYFSRYNNVIRIADEAMNEPANEGC